MNATQTDSITLEELQEHADEFTTVRRRLHRNPELSYQEHGTADLVAERLEVWGYRVERGLGGTGVVGRLTLGDGKRAIGLRADMDALPIQEETGLEYASCSAGVMHACGHDGHTAMLLAAAKLLAERQAFSGTLNLIFQPAEEHGPPESGAVRMINQGLFEKYPCDAIYAMHTMPGWPQGSLVFKEGAMMAGSDKAVITIRGQGGHCAMPHKAADPIVAASSLVMALQTVVARNVDPLETAVVNVGVLQSGQASNIIPPSARLEINIRSLNKDVRATLKRRIIELAHSQAQSFGTSAEVEYIQGYAPLVNTKAETDYARRIATELLGDQGVIKDAPALTISEDFAFMLEKCPGCYLLIGNGGGADGISLHHPKFNFNDDNVGVGAAYWTRLVEGYLTS